MLFVVDYHTISYGMGMQKLLKAIPFSPVIQCGFAKRTWHKHAGDIAARKII